MTADTGPWLRGKLRALEDLLYEVQDPPVWISICKDMAVWTPPGDRG